MQPVLITTKVVSSNPVHGEMYYFVSFAYSSSGYYQVLYSLILAIDPIYPMIFIIHVYFFLGPTDPTCLVYMDTPAQTFSTSECRGTANPFWDEQFLL